MAYKSDLSQAELGLEMLPGYSQACAAGPVPRVSDGSITAQHCRPVPGCWDPQRHGAHVTLL